jgi:hypothetical protein
MIEIKADERRVFQSLAVVTHEVRHAAGRIDLVIRAIRDARLRDDDFHAARELFFEDYDPRHARVGGAGSDVELHWVYDGLQRL